jgi:hypothetical protein
MTKITVESRRRTEGFPGRASFSLPAKKEEREWVSEVANLFVDYLEEGWKLYDFRKNYTPDLEIIKAVCWLDPWPIGRITRELLVDFQIVFSPIKDVRIELIVHLTDYRSELRVFKNEKGCYVGRWEEVSKTMPWSFSLPAKKPEWVARGLISAMQFAIQEQINSAEKTIKSFRLVHNQLSMFSA